MPRGSKYLNLDLHRNWSYDYIGLTKYGEFSQYGLGDRHSSNSGVQSPDRHTLHGFTQHFWFPSEISEGYILGITPGSFFPGILVCGVPSGLFLWHLQAFPSRIRVQSLRLQECDGLFNSTVSLGSIGPPKRAQLEI